MTLHVPKWDFADRVRKVRTDEGLNQEQMAAALGVPRARYSHWELGNYTPQDIVSIARRIQDRFHVPADWVLGLDDCGNGD